MAERIEAPHYPIIYVRGYAATMQEVEDTTADPYMGFNLGSTLLRQDYSKRPRKFIFESPLLRLIKDHHYQDAYRQGNDEYEPGTAPARSIWVFRYYEKVSESLGSGGRRSMEQFGADLRAFILRVRDAVCAGDAAKKAFRVHLVAHSMGGLVCRCYLQRTCRAGAPDPADNVALELVPGKQNDSLVEKVFTYATPHNGIDIFGINVPNLGDFDRLQLGNFDRDRIREYLGLPEGSPANDLGGAFPPQRFFSFIGSNYRDYKAFFGLARHTTGPLSDGLVLMENAWVRNTPRAVAHRSHSGHYGIVNSESGYQNLQRFLFGDLRVSATLEFRELLLPKAVQEHKDRGRKIRGSYYIDATTRVRGAATYVLNERRFDQESAILKTYDELIGEGKAVYLFSGYLSRAAITHGTGLTFGLDLAVRVPQFEIDNRFWFDEHVEGFLFSESYTFAVRDSTVRYGSAREQGHGVATRLLKIRDLGQGCREVRVPVATGARVRPGLRAELVLRIDPWN
ncbi:hypothetical protein GCM10011348_23610 [Marinobacterium nitratireducens]|uniref:Uncharacterized protein n=1 Tax=Marinobacterium nitratireducens TaxID=518897 RepID=A0A917ZH28_9GAMM|nr:hypothetical protein [Marinobacterium nitratireducens]GGO82372.1 hypothetical protein GCM10011348_23610 [Marinobacterium nitratireducens]